MKVIAIVSSIIIILGCFMPWIQLGTLITNRGIDNPDGAIMLVASIISLALGIYNQSQKRKNFLWLYLIVGIIGMIVVVIDLIEVKERAQKIAKSIEELNELFGSQGEISLTNFIGSGLYIVGLGSIGLILVGLEIFKLKPSQNYLANDLTESEYKPKIVSPKYLKTEVLRKTTAELENEQYEKDIIRLKDLTILQQRKTSEGIEADEIKNLLKKLVSTKEEALHLINSYNSIFPYSDLLTDLKRIDNKEYLKKNLSVLIEIGVIESEYPYNRIYSH